MSRTVKVRPDQPLFTAEGIRMPLWLHLPWEIGRGITRWLFVALQRDNPHRNVMHNPTLTRGAKVAHRNAYWTGKPVTKGPKWRTMLRRWSMVLFVASLVKYAPGAFWVGLGKTVWGALMWFFTVALVWAWANLWVLPLVLGLFVLSVWAVMVGGQHLRVFLVARSEAREAGDAGAGIRWYDVVLRAHHLFWAWVHGRGKP